jgi:hypothetical protein
MESKTTLLDALEKAAAHRVSLPAEVLHGHTAILFIGLIFIH